MSDINSHDKISHDSIDFLGKDWGHVGNPSKLSKTPQTAFFPRNETTLRQALKKAGPNFIIRGKGHSDNNLVIGEDPSVPVISTERLVDERWPTIERIGPRKRKEGTITVLSGWEIGKLDEELNKRGWSLPVVPDHPDISIGGFASVGGISPASHKHGLFVDNIRGMTILNRKTRKKDTIPHEDVFKYLGKTGQENIILSLTCRVIERRKEDTYLRATWTDVFKDREVQAARDAKKPEAEIVHLAAGIYRDAMADIVAQRQTPALYKRGFWSMLPQATGGIAPLGLIADYKEVDAKGGDLVKIINKRNRTIRRLESIGEVAGNFPAEMGPLESSVKILGMQQLVEQTKFVNCHDVESLVDRVIDASVGSPSYMLSMFVKEPSFKETFDKARQLCDKNLVPAGGFLVGYAIYSRPITSPFLSGAKNASETDKKFADLSLYLVLPPGKPDLYPKIETRYEKVFVPAFDDICTEARGYRYMCTRTSFGHREKPEKGTHDTNPGNRWVLKKKT